MIQMTAHTPSHEPASHRSIVSVSVCSVQVCDDHTIDERVELSGARDVREVREAARVVVAHVHATVEDDVLATDRDQHTATADILTGAERHYLDVHGDGGAAARHATSSRQPSNWRQVSAASLLALLFYLRTKSTSNVEIRSLITLI